MSEKKAYEKKMDAMIREWSAKIDVLKAKADKAGAEQEIKYRETLQKLRKKRDEAHRKFDELRASGDVAWEEFRGGVDQAWNDLKKSIERAQEKFKK
jgi:uncharacterized coiled-coil DUF342 family protein